MSIPVILVVDDEVDLLAITAEAVRRTLPAYQVREATSLQQARQVLDEVEQAGHHLALAVVDHVLGNGVGLPLLLELEQRFPEASRMLFTGRASQEVEEQAHDRGVHVLWKPVRLDRLVDEMTVLLAS